MMDEIVFGFAILLVLCWTNVGPLRHRQAWMHGPVELMTVLMSDSGITANVVSVLCRMREE